MPILKVTFSKNKMKFKKQRKTKRNKEKTREKLVYIKIIQ